MKRPIGCDGDVASILVVDPSSRYRQWVQETLYPYYTVITCATAQEATQFLERNRFTMAFVDTQTPPRGIIGVLQTMPRYDDGGAVPIVMTCDAMDTLFFEQCRAAGVDDALVKPFTKRALLEKAAIQVRRAIEMSWERLDKTSRAVLRGTADSFRATAAAVEAGSGIDFPSLRESCAPLIEAVENQSINGILKGLKGHDDYTFVHSLRAATFLSFFGHTIGIRGEDLRTLAIGGLLHDIGKVRISLDILNKPGKLDTSEWAVMRAHVDSTMGVLMATEGVPHGVNIVAGQHHEKLDGTGYPKGLKSGQLNELARMAAIVDVFGALTDRRPYKPPRPLPEAFAAMEAMGGHHLDAGLVNLFKQIVGDADAVLH